MSIKERWEKAKEKTFNFLNEHIEEIVVGGLFIGGIAIGAAIGYDIGRGEERKRILTWIDGREKYLLEKLEEKERMLPMIEETEEEERMPPMIEEVDDEETDEEADTETDIPKPVETPFWSRGWSEELYREDYEKVKAFASELNLHPGESWFIEDQSQYSDSDEVKPVIGHMIDGTGVYPPNEN